MYGQGETWRHITSRQLAITSARAWSKKEQTLIEIYQLEVPAGPFRVALCMVLNGVELKRRRWSAYRNGRIIAAWGEEDFA